MAPTTLRVEKMIYGGDGVVGSDSGTQAKALPFSLPGELVEVDATGSVKIVEPSSDRVAPACIHFGECGGCHYQHASYPAQIVIKRGILRDVFASAGMVELPEIVAYPAEPLHYRNRIRLRIAEVMGANGSGFRVGYNRRDAAGTMLPVTMCPIASPLLWRAAEALLALARSESTVARWLETAVEIECFATGDESKLQMVLFVRGNPASDFNAFCELLKHAVSELAGAAVAILPMKPSQRGRRSERAKPGPQWGVTGMIYPVGGDKHWVSRGSFFQANRFLVAKLVELATVGRKGALAWDLYAGVGLFSRALTRSFAQVIAVEAAEPAASDLAAALRGTSHRALAMTTLDFLQAAVLQRERPDLIVMDPPRAGIGADVCALLARVGAAELVYVSCDPVTLARDVKQLEGSGYTLSSLHLVDMFPQTFHIESVAVLRLAE